MWVEDNDIQFGDYVMIDPELFKIYGQLDNCKPTVCQVLNRVADSIADVYYIRAPDHKTLGAGWLILLHRGSLTKDMVDMWIMLGYDCSMINNNEVYENV